MGKLPILRVDRRRQSIESHFVSDTLVFGCLKIILITAATTIAIKDILH